MSIESRPSGIGAEIKPKKSTKRLIPHPVSRESARGATPLSRETRREIVGQYRDLVREAESARAVFRQSVKQIESLRESLKDTRSESKQEKIMKEIKTAEAVSKKWLFVFTRQKEQIRAMREKYGASLERAQRDLVHERLNYVNFQVIFGRLAEVERAIHEYNAPNVGEDEQDFSDRPSAHNQALRQKAVASQMDRGCMTTHEQISDIIEEDWAESLTDSLDILLGEGQQEQKKEYEDKIFENLGETEEPDEKSFDESLIGLSLAELKTKKYDLVVDCEELWEKPGVQRRWFEKTFHGWVEANQRGERVMEFPSVIKLMNELDDIERTHSDTTIGGVLVGEPGVGKTVVIEHYLDRKGRKYVPIDMSEEVTRYQLFGSPSLETESKIDQFKRISETVSGLSDDEIVEMVEKHAERLAPSFSSLSKDELSVIAFEQLRETVCGDRNNEVKFDNADAVRDRLGEIARSMFVTEVAKKMEDLTKKNGWRDGVIISALRNGHSVIIDEFNKAKSWTLIHRLTTSRPGDDYFFADNNEYIRIPEDWRMYFTGNIGKKHGTFAVREAFASRIGGKVIEVDVPPEEEERTAMLAFISDSDDRLMRSIEDVVHLMEFIKDITPKIRHAIRDQRNIIPISYRLLRDLSNELVDKKRNKSTEKTLDEALFRVLIRPYAVHETRELAVNIVKLCHAGGLLLGEEVEDDIVKWTGMSKDDIKKKREEYRAAEGDTAERLERMREGDAHTMTAKLPEISHV